jgi:hypothetical protein
MHFDITGYGSFDEPILPATLGGGTVLPIGAGVFGHLGVPPLEVRGAVFPPRARGR